MNKKVFISLPMRGRKIEYIEYSLNKLISIAKIIWGEDIEILHRDINDNLLDYVNKPLLGLGKSFESLSDADYLLSCSSYFSPEIDLERNAFLDFKYGENVLDIPLRKVMCNEEIVDNDSEDIPF